MRQLGIQDRRAQVREQAQFAQPQQAGLGALVARLFVPGGPPMAQDTASARARRPTMLGQRIALGVDGGTANQRFVQLDVEPVVAGQRVQHADRLAADLGPDAIAGHDEYFRGHESSLVRYAAITPLRPVAVSYEFAPSAVLRQDEA